MRHMDPMRLMNTMRLMSRLRCDVRRNMMPNAPQRKRIRRAAAQPQLTASAVGVYTLPA
jgi:hypothetical protein